MIFDIRPLCTLDPEQIKAFQHQNQRYGSVFHELLRLSDMDGDISFAVMKGSDILAICPLIEEPTSTGPETYLAGSMLGLSLPAPILSQALTGEKMIKEIAKNILAAVDEIAREHSLAKISYNLANYMRDELRAGCLYTEMKKRGYLDIWLPTIKLSLEAEPSEIMRDFSKGHRAAIKRYEGMEVFFDEPSGESLSPETFHERLQAFYPDSLIGLLYLLYHEGNLKFGLLHVEGELVAFSIFLTYGDRILYFAAKRLVETEYPVHHLILWNAVAYFRRRGLKCLDMGVVADGPYLNYSPSEKQLAINRFKKGFGGELTCFVCEEKFFRRDIFRLEYEERLSRFAERYIDA